MTPMDLWCHLPAIVLLFNTRGLTCFHLRYWTLQLNDMSSRLWCRSPQELRRSVEVCQLQALHTDEAVIQRKLITPLFAIFQGDSAFEYLALIATDQKSQMYSSREIASFPHK
jgi:hypothetical protein